MTLTDPLEHLLRPGSLVAVADGAGSPSVLLGPLARAARTVGNIRLLLGWCLELPDDLDFSAFADVRTYMPGYALRTGVRDGTVEYLPARLGTLPALLAGPLRPDLLILGMRPGKQGLSFGTEVSWMAAAAQVATNVVAVVDTELPLASAEPSMSPSEATVILEIERGPVEVPERAQSALMSELGARVAALIPEGAAVQIGPGSLGRAIGEHIQHPVHIDSGVVTDMAMHLDSRRLLIDTPRAAYIVGSKELYSWAHGKAIVTNLDVTHDIQRLGALPFVSINTALSIDLDGQVGIESASGAQIAGIGGHADYALAGARSRGGMSIIALPSMHEGRPTLQEHLKEPVSTPRSDVDVIVTERGTADLRGLSESERRSAIERIWT